MAFVSLKAGIALTTLDVPKNHHQWDEEQAGEALPGEIDDPENPVDPTALYS